MKENLIFTYKIKTKYKRIDFYLNDKYFWGGNLIYFNEYENCLFYVHMNSHNENISLLQDFIEYIDQNIGKLYKFYEIDKCCDVGHYYFKLNNNVSLEFIT